MPEYTSGNSWSGRDVALPGRWFSYIHGTRIAGCFMKFLFKVRLMRKLTIGSVLILAMAVFSMNAVAQTSDDITPSEEILNLYMTS